MGKGCLSTDISIAGWKELSSFPLFPRLCASQVPF
ncbi:hypothetical protein BACCAP_02434 [Pseudoflavonifractor capillosus ATCC 29799]|uniref:Uncharacterized protein n=1 Tax=Pseudoflavonifractor capillosus ATCC 29799 TaxID=411467 RepID=A6NW41_9FIRM|nr:hypothetical protein BACCAP_02434 [Pseudoflavonifractor capillosus ATCC 29799]